MAPPPRSLLCAPCSPCRQPSPLPALPPPPHGRSSPSSLLVPRHTRLTGMPAYPYRSAAALHVSVMHEDAPGCFMSVCSDNFGALTHRVHPFCLLTSTATASGCLQLLEMGQQAAGAYGACRRRLSPPRAAAQATAQLLGRTLVRHESLQEPLSAPSTPVTPWTPLTCARPSTAPEQRPHRPGSPKALLQPIVCAAASQVEQLPQMQPAQAGGAQMQACMWLCPVHARLAHHGVLYC